MGLDMYLKAKVYFGGFTDTQLNEKRGAIINEMFGIETPTSDWGVDSITFDVAYWRKANAIHNWFVQNVQDGFDDCRDAYVSNEQLQRLVDDCKRCITNPNDAPNILPTVCGCFFGPTDYDDGYFQDMKDTIEQIERLLNSESFKEAYVYYHSSW